MAFIPNYGKSGSAPDCKNCWSFFFSLYHQYLNHQAEPYARISRKHGSGIKTPELKLAASGKGENCEGMSTRAHGTIGPQVQAISAKAIPSAKKPVVPENHGLVY